ncbi:F-box domain [Arabidopsis suecica]|uniref:F-box domain n=1 Tax=Arabidopsis suecica TaxID=45249 RepID=A0A8T2CMV0_ARASU|nr:F-box domain [Arabidopsis suecica]
MGGSVSKMSLPESTPNPQLPDDLLITCLSRVSKLYYPTLSLVSKSFRSLLASPELYEARSLLRRNESCLYVCLRFDANPCWFTLCRKPDRTLTKSSGNLLVPITSPQSHPPYFSGNVAVGSNIYNISRYIETLASSRVSVLDFWSHTWREASSLQVKMKYPCGSFFDGKIYVVEGFLEDVSEFSKMEVFDTKTQIWDHVTIPYRDQYSRLLTKITCIEGKVYLTIGRKVLAYDPKEGRWDFVEREMSMRWNWLSNCAIENVLYCYNEGDLEWYDKKVRLWKQIKGLRGLPEFARSSLVKLADYGGKMAVVWDKYEPDSEDKMIWCAVIALQRHNVEEIWGKVEWCDAVLTVPRSTILKFALAATV